LKLKNTENELELIIEDGLLNRLGKLGVRHFPNEFGGFLIGYYAGNFKTLFVTDCVLPRKYKGSSLGFERSTDGLEKSFKKLFDQKKQYYVGEWHTHPNGSTMFSQTDLKAMINAVECETVQITNPILLILSVGSRKIISYRFYYYDDQRLIPYE
jgi:integrative and conjugative element protein (TIGR02256 family)